MIWLGVLAWVGSPGWLPWAAAASGGGHYRETRCNGPDVKQHWWRKSTSACTAATALVGIPRPDAKQVPSRRQPRPMRDCLQPRNPLGTPHQQNLHRSTRDVVDSMAPSDIGRHAYADQDFVCYPEP